jgi:hypothetical protein
MRAHLVVVLEADAVGQGGGAGGKAGPVALDASSTA